MFRTHTCGELSAANQGQKVTLAGWVQHLRDLGQMVFIDLRDRYGITQLAFNEKSAPGLLEAAKKLGREYVIQAEGTVIERASKNPNNPTGEVELMVERLEVLNPSDLPPFTIEDESDGGEDLRMRYRYLDIRRNPVKNNLLLRARVTMAVRKYLTQQGFVDIETPYLIKSTPEGARDFVVPSRMNPGEFYALPQSPQTFKQLLMVAGMDKYYQIVRCFRDEDLRADRQPEFTQVDCEMSFVEQEDILNTFEGLFKYLLKEIRDIEIDRVPRITYAEAMRTYGSDKPDIRFDMRFHELNQAMKGKGFSVFDNAPLVVGLVVEGCAGYSRKQTDELTDWVKRPQIGGSGLVYIKYNPDGTFKSSVDKFYSPQDLQAVAQQMGAHPGDLILIMAGAADRTRKALGALRMELATRLGLRNPDVFAPLWVVDFPLFEWDEETQRYYAMHHPFTSPKREDIPLLETDPGAVRANAYDIVLNGNEIGGGSIRIHDRETQMMMFRHLGFTPEKAEEQFGFLMNAFRYGAPPHGGLAFGLDRLVALLGGNEIIRDFIAFPKNNSGRDVMIDAPAPLAAEQLDELNLTVKAR